jgi:hypothetical protein
VRRSMLVVTMAAVACAACATTGAGKGEMREYKIDEVVPLGPEGSAQVSLKSGPFEIVQLLVRNQPSAKDILEDKRGTDRSHPKPTIVARSSATETAMVSLASILEDENGKPLMTCNSRRDQDLVGGVTDDWNTCFMEAILTQDWPKVKNFHVIVTFRVREEAPAQ